VHRLSPVGTCGPRFAAVSGDGAGRMPERRKGAVVRADMRVSVKSGRALADLAHGR